MFKRPLFVIASSAALLSACQSQNDAAEDQMEDAAEASAVAAGPAEAALGLSEMQLLDAELVDANGVELGDVEGVARNANNEVDRLLVEIEDSNPDRFVHVPVTDLTTVINGDDTNVATNMTRDQLAALPEVTR